MAEVVYLNFQLDPVPDPSYDLVFHAQMDHYACPPSYNEDLKATTHMARE